jgi:hypothetical protein
MPSVEASAGPDRQAHLVFGLSGGNPQISQILTD